MSLSTSIYLVGVKHSGKSVVGKLMSASTGLPFLDTDEIIEALFYRDYGKRLRVREIYRLDDGVTFRELEAQAVADAADRGGPAIVATGGGLCDNEPALRNIKGIVVCLEADIGILLERIRRRGIPAYLKSTTMKEAEREFTLLHSRRSERYREIADFALDGSGLEPEEVAREILAELELTHGGK